MAQGSGLGSGSSMENSARLSVLPAPPPRPEYTRVPRPIFTVSGVLSAMLSVDAVSVIAATVAVVPEFGPVKTTRALELLRLA